MLSNNVKQADALPASLVEAEARTAAPEQVTGDVDANESKKSKSPPTASMADIEYPSGLKLDLIITSAFTSMFLVSLVSIPTHSISSGHRE